MGGRKMIASAINWDFFLQETRLVVTVSVGCGKLLVFFEKPTTKNAQVQARLNFMQETIYICWPYIDSIFLLKTMTSIHVREIF